MMEEEYSSSESGSMMGDVADGRPTGDNMWVVTGSASMSPPESAERASGFSPRVAAPGWQTKPLYVVEPTPITNGSNIAVVPHQMAPYQGAGPGHRIGVSPPQHPSNPSPRTVMPTGLSIVTSPRSPAYTHTSSPNTNYIMPIQHPTSAEQGRTTSWPSVVQQQPTVLHQSQPIRTPVQSTAVPQQVVRQVPTNAQHQPLVNYRPMGVDINPSALSAMAQHLPGNTLTAQRTPGPVTTSHPYNVHVHAAPRTSVHKASKHPHDVGNSPLVDLHGRPTTILPRIAPPLSKDRSEKWPQQSARAVSLLSYATTDRRFSLDTSPWSTKAEWMPAFRSGVNQYPDHIHHRHPAFPQGAIPSPLALYYFDETAPNPILLRNDVPLDGVQKFANDLKRCDGCAGPQQKVATRGLKPHLSSSLDGDSLQGGLDEDLTMSSGSTTASHTDDTTIMRDASMSDLTSAMFDSAYAPHVPTKQKQSGGVCCPGSVSSRQFTHSGKATTEFDTTASRTASGPRGYSKPLSSARSARSGRSGYSTARSGPPDGVSSSKLSKSKRSVSRSPSQSRVSSFVHPKYRAQPKPKRSAICCGRDDDYSSESRPLSRYASSVFSSSDGLTSASSLHQHHNVPMSTPYIRVDPASSKTFERPSADPKYLSPERPSSYRGTARTTSVASSVSSRSSRRPRSSASRSRQKSAPRSAISAVPGYVKKKRTDCCGNETTVMEPTSYVMDSFSRSGSIYSTTTKSIADRSSRARSKSQSKYSERSASRGRQSDVSRLTSTAGTGMPRTATDMSRLRSAAKPKQQAACCGGGQESSYPASMSSARFGSQSLGTHSEHLSYRHKEGSKSYSGSGSSYSFSDSHSEVSQRTSPSSYKGDRRPASKVSGRGSRTGRTGPQRSASRLSRMTSASRSRTALSGTTSNLEDFSFSRSTTFQTDYSRAGGGKGMCRPQKDLQYDVYKFFFDARDVKPAKRGTQYKMLPQFSTSYKGYPNVAYEVVAPRNRHDFMQSRRLPAFAA